jgi:hypothetical protein
MAALRPFLPRRGGLGGFWTPRQMRLDLSIALAHLAALAL